MQRTMNAGLFQVRMPGSRFLLRSSRFRLLMGGVASLFLIAASAPGSPTIAMVPDSTDQQRDLDKLCVGATADRGFADCRSDILEILRRTSQLSLRGRDALWPEQVNSVFNVKLVKTGQHPINSLADIYKYNRNDNSLELIIYPNETWLELEFEGAEKAAAAGFRTAVCVTAQDAAEILRDNDWRKTDHAEAPEIPTTDYYRQNSAYIRVGFSRKTGCLISISAKGS